MDLVQFYYNRSESYRNLATGMTVLGIELRVVCISDECLTRLKEACGGSHGGRQSSIGDLLADFSEQYLRLMATLRQKKKMASLLAPVGYELPVLSNQLQQTRVCKLQKNWRQYKI